MARQEASCSPPRTGSAPRQRADDSAHLYYPGMAGQTKQAKVRSAKVHAQSAKVDFCTVQSRLSTCTTSRILTFVPSCCRHPKLAARLAVRRPAGRRRDIARLCDFFASDIFSRAVAGNCKTHYSDCAACRALVGSRLSTLQKSTFALSGSHFCTFVLW